MSRKSKGKSQPSGKFKKLLRDQVVTLFKKNRKKPLNHKQIASAIGIRTASDRALLFQLLFEMTEANQLEEIERGKYKLAIQEDSNAEGRIEFTKSGSAYVIPFEGDTDIFIPSDKTKDSFNGDIVRVRFSGAYRKNPEGEVVDVLERGMASYVGIIKFSKNFAFVNPTNKRIHKDFYIPKEHWMDANEGDKVIVELLDWPKDAESPFGKVIEVLGPPGDNEVEMHAILAEFGLPYEFPENVLDAADKIPTRIPSMEISQRRDFREITTFTIDPEDAKDFDDALSVHYLENGNIEVGIHIADVSYYLEPGSVLEKEAVSRATSVYLVDRVVPMLPEVLSNNVCSLRPNEDKLCFSAVFELNDLGQIKKEWFGRTIINSNRRFTYEDAQQIIEGGEGDFKKEILLLDGLAKKLREKRFKEGAIEFGGSEVKFKLDENGKPISVFEKVMKDSNKLIEEFMLLANKRVAEFIGKNPKNAGKAFVYRVHDLPDVEKIKTLKDFVKRLGYKLQVTSEENAARGINRLLKEIEGKTEEDIIKQMAIRAMAKAIYTTENIGHYGLAFDHYTHFTSPIRRYPDVMVHRLLDQYLKENSKTADAKELELKCRHSSIMERKASEAERASIKYKQVEFMLDKIGQEFMGVISGLTRWGIYVEIIENRCEGLVTLNSLKDDNYYFDEEKYQVIGSNYKEVYNFGDTVKIRVRGADLALKQLDFEMVS